jgi:glutathione S-transferase
MPTVIGVQPSPFVRKVRVSLAEKGVAYDLEPVPPFPPHNATPEFRRMSPLGKVPALRDGDFAVSDSSVICAYLERTHPEPALYPPDPRRFARTLWYEEYADTRLSEKVGAIFVQRVLRPKVFHQDTDTALVDRVLREELPPVFDYLEGELGDDDAIVPPRFSIADIAIASQLQNLRHAKVEVDASRWPKLARYANAILSRPSFKGCVAEEERLFASL